MKLKKIFILIVTLLTVCLFVTGCSSKSPTDVVNAYFTELKKEDSSQAANFIESAISQTEEMTEQVDGEEESEEFNTTMEEALKIFISKIDAKVLSEEINDDNATVKVELNGQNLANMMLQTVGESILDAFSGQDINEEYMANSLLEKIKDSETEVRNGQINLTKEDKEWKIKFDENLQVLLIGTTDDTNN